MQARKLRPYSLLAAFLAAFAVLVFRSAGAQEPFDGAGGAAQGGLAGLEAAHEAAERGDLGRTFDGDFHGRAAVAASEQDPLQMPKTPGTYPKPPARPHKFTPGDLSLPGLEKCEGFFSCFGHTLTATVTMPLAAPITGANRAAIWGSEYGDVAGTALGVAGGIAGLVIGIFFTPFTLMVGLVKSFKNLFAGKL